MPERRAARAACGRSPAPTTAVLSDYGSARGSLALRRLLLGRLAEEDIAAATGPAHADGLGHAGDRPDLPLPARGPGDTVLVDDPCYFNFRALLRAHQARIVGVPYTPSGPTSRASSRRSAANRPRLYITNSALHNPTGATPLAADRAPAARPRRRPTISPSSRTTSSRDFEPDAVAAPRRPRWTDRVIRIGSFSKTLSASVRCGYIAARADWVEELVDLQVATSFGGPSPVATETDRKRPRRRQLSQAHGRAAADARAGASRRRARARGVRHRTLDHAARRLLSLVPPARRSRFRRHRTRSLEKNVVLAPGNVFSVSQSAGSFLRFNVAQSADERVFAVIRRAMETGGPHRATGAPGSRGRDSAIAPRGQGVGLGEIPEATRRG